ncbi:MAG: bifunctional phosphopantothenoylcysteine decarboxylase/phosphopantothenate--cysteine ligase CoaBC [Calditrichia bacterium]
MFPSQLFKNRKILVGITGGIAAYKTIELIRYLVTQEAQVRVIMTSSAEKFITPLTLETLSRNPVLKEMFPEESFSGTHHIKWADWAEAAIIAPATYNFIGKIWAGVADDLLTTMVAALQCPVVIAPAMNVNMWNNPILQRNLTELKKNNYLLCPPAEGFLAEGYSGMGRLAPLEHLVQYLYRAIHPDSKSFSGKKVLVTAGRTEEYLDPVRFLSNRSSGKMGFALAWEAFARGAEVTLIHGPTELPSPVDIQCIPVTSAQQMFEAVEKHFPESDFFISAAAVADYQSKEPAKHKLKKGEEGLILQLVRTPDILKEVAIKKTPGQKLIGFAVETEDEKKNALKKLRSKNLNLIALNNPLEAGSGFRSDTNKVTLLTKDKEKELPLMAKLDVAFEIFDFLIKNVL